MEFFQFIHKGDNALQPHLRCRQRAVQPT